MTIIPWFSLFFSEKTMKLFGLNTVTEAVKLL